MIHWIWPLLHHKGVEANYGWQIFCLRLKKELVTMFPVHRQGREDAHRLDRNIYIFCCGLVLLFWCLQMTAFYNCNMHYCTLSCPRSKNSELSLTFLLPMTILPVDQRYSSARETWSTDKPASLDWEHSPPSLAKHTNKITMVPFKREKTEFKSSQI